MWLCLFFHWYMLVAVLSLLTVVNFPADSCTGGSGNNGTCLASQDCRARQGAPDGPCANGFGVCCMCKNNKLILYTGGWFLIIKLYTSLQILERTAERPIDVLFFLHRDSWRNGKWHRILFMSEKHLILIGNFFLIPLRSYG